MKGRGCVVPSLPGLEVQIAVGSLAGRAGFSASRPMRSDFSDGVACAKPISRVKGQGVVGPRDLQENLGHPLPEVLRENGLAADLDDAADRERKPHDP